MTTVTSFQQGLLSKRPAASGNTGLVYTDETGKKWQSNGEHWSEADTAVLATGGTSAADATTTVPGAVEVDQAPSGDHPVALTTDGLELPAAMLGAGATQAMPGDALPGVASDGAGGLALDGGITATNEALSGPGGSTSTHSSTQASGQTGYLYQGIGSDTNTKFSVGVDGEVLTTDDLLAPLGTVKGKVLEIVPQAAAGAPSTGAHNAGEFYADTSGGLFYCTASGTPGTWKTVGLS